MRRPLIVVFIILLVALVALYFGKNQRIGDRNHIPVSGNIEITQVNASFEVAGRLEQRLVDEGEIVKKGQVIGLLDFTPLQQELEQQQAQVQASQAALNEIQRGTLPESITQAESLYEQAKAQFERQKEDYDRQKQLYETKVISRKEFDASQANYTVALTRLRETEENLHLLKTETQPERIKQAKAQLESAQQQLALRETRYRYGTLRSPLDAIVLSKNMEPGEYASVGASVVTLGNFDDTWLRAYIPETELGRVKLGQKVQVTTDSYPNKVYDGTISFISQEAEFTPKNIQTFEERVKLVYRIKITIDNSSRELKPGMPADALILVD